MSETPLPIALWFTERMAARLRALPIKSDYPRALLVSLREETATFAAVMNDCHDQWRKADLSDLQRERLIDEAADIANYAMELAWLAHISGSASKAKRAKATP